MYKLKGVTDDQTVMQINSGIFAGRVFPAKPASGKAEIVRFLAAQSFATILVGDCVKKLPFCAMQLAPGRGLVYTGDLPQPSKY